MNIKDLLKRFKKQEEPVNETASDISENEENETDEIGTGTKVKVLAALLVAGFAAYVAWWVQEPSQMSANLLAQSTSVMEESATEEIASLTAENANTVISIKDFAFSPDEIMIEKGETVTWKNEDAIAHTVTGSTFSSGTLNAGDSYSYSFTDDGTFEYTCSFHPQMTGKIIVGTGVAAESTEMVAMEEPAVTDEVAVTEAPEFYSPEELLPAAAEETALEQPLTANETVAETQEDAAHAAAESEEIQPTKLAKSGPEDIIYFGIFGVILYLNRKKLVSAFR
jgi:plastocyanin